MFSSPKELLFAITPKLLLIGKGVKGVIAVRK